MEHRSDNLEVQMNALSCQTPNHQTFFANEDVAVTSETAIERSDVVEIEKTLVIQKKFFVNEKIVVPKQTVTYSQNQLLLGSQALCIDANASLICSEVCNRDSQESGKMEIASQESLDSRMDISSQESRFSLMEYSSQEADVPITPGSNGCIPNKEVVASIKGISDARLGKEIATPMHPVDVLPTEECSDKVPTIEKPPFLQDDIPDQDDVLNIKDMSKRSVQEYRNYEIALENEAGYLKRKGSVGSADEYFKRRLSTEKSMLTREEAVTAREVACMSREKAIVEREAAIANQGTDLRETAENDLPSPKRLKLISVFEYS